MTTIIVSSGTTTSVSTAIAITKAYIVETTGTLDVLSSSLRSNNDRPQIGVGQRISRCQ
jgi:hypothetical protein